MACADPQVGIPAGRLPNPAYGDPSGKGRVWDYNQENNTVKDLADEPKQDHALALMGDDEPLVVDLDEDAAPVEECEYCGHFPCGCGG
jgi:hypothetical protein